MSLWEVFRRAADFKEQRNAEQWSINEGRIRFTPTIARGIRLAPISSPLSFQQLFPPYLFRISPNAHRICHNCKTMANGGSRPKLFHQRLCVTWSEPLFSQTSLVNARVSLVPCNWYNVKKQFSDRPEKTYGPCLWSESVWCIHEGEQLHPVIKAER